MQADFVDHNDQCWTEFLSETPHDMYHLPGYVRLCADQDDGEAIAFIAEQENNRLLFPLIIRRIEHGNSQLGTLFDVASPYGYPSPLLSSDQSEEEQTRFLNAALEKLMAGLRQRGVVSAFVRLNPLLPLPLEPFRKHGTLVLHGQTVFNDLTESEDELWKQTRKSTRKIVQRCKRKGYVAEMDCQWDHFEVFHSIYLKTMRRLAADESYLFSRQYFYELRDVLNGDLQIGIVRLGNEVTCASMYSEVGGIVQAHLSGARPEFNKDSPTTLLDHYARSWAKQRGNHIFHMGGGRGGTNDSLFQFKAGFSKQRADFYTLRIVVQEDAYRELTAQRSQEDDWVGDDRSSFFPAYRRIQSPDISPGRSQSRPPSTEHPNAMLRPSR